MSLALLTDYTALFQIQSPDTPTQARIQRALDIATAEIQNGRRLFVAGNRVSEPVDGTGRPSFLLPRQYLPVTGLTLVQEMRDWDTAFDTVDPSSYDWDADGIVTLNGRVWNVWTCRRQGLLVDFTYGYAIIPQEVAGICLARASRILGDPGDNPIVREQLGDYQVEYEPGGGLLGYEREMLKQYEVER